MKLNKLTTETRNPDTINLDELSSYEIIKKINTEDKKVAYCVEKELESISIVVDNAVKCVNKGGRIIYVGAGTSGRIGVLDAVECPPTFGVNPNKVVGLLAGGIGEKNAKEEAEDDASLGKKDLLDLNLDNTDMVIGIAASGRTPYVIGALDYANEIGANTASICCNKDSDVSKHATYPIEIDNGPEVLTGSTRMKAGTSQKMVCNMISTATMIQVGKVYENLMVDVEVSNQKLRARWDAIVFQATGVSQEIISSYYDISDGNAKTAIVMILLNINKEEAKSLLENNGGFVKKAIEKEVI